MAANTARNTVKEKRSIIIGRENGKNVTNSQSKLEKCGKMKVISQESIYVQARSARFGSAYNIRELEDKVRPN